MMVLRPLASVVSGVGRQPPSMSRRGTSMTLIEAALRVDQLLPEMSIDSACGPGETARLYAKLMAGTWPGKTDYSAADVRKFVRELRKSVAEGRPA